MKASNEQERCKSAWNYAQ